MFTLLSGVLVLDSNIDLLMLGWLAEDADVGVYRSATQTVVVVESAAAALNMVVAPQITRLYRSGDRDGLRRIVRQDSRFIAAAGVPIVAFFMIYGDTFLRTVFGDVYCAARAGPACSDTAS